MAWYRTGTVAVTNASTTVTGTGTAFVANVSAGEAFIGPDGKTYEVASVTSDTVLVLATAYAGSTASGQAYQIGPYRGRINELNSNVADLLTRYANLAVDSSGRVGIGTTSLVVKFEVASNAEIARFRTSTARGGGNGFLGFYDPTGRKGYWGYGDAADNLYYFNEMNASVLFGTNALERMRITAAGNVGIGTVVPSYKLDVGGTARAWTFKANTPTGADSFGFEVPYSGDTCFFGRTGPSFPLTFGWLGPDQNYIYSAGGFRIGGSAGYVEANQGNLYAGGDVRFGATSSISGEKFTFSNTGAQPHTYLHQTNSADMGILYQQHGRASGATSAVMTYFINSTGSAVGSITSTGSATSFNTSSDIRLKSNIAPAADAGSIIDSINVVQHDWNEGGSVRFGVIAQELNEVFPEAVTAGDDGEEIEKVWGVDSSKAVWLLLKEVQDLRARVAALEGGA